MKPSQACFFFLIPFSAASLLFNLQVTAQKEDTSGGSFGIFNSQGEYRQFMGSLKRAAYGPEGSKELQAMVPMLNDIALNKPIGSTAGKFKAGSSTFGMLSNEKVRDEIEMIDQQYQELQQANARIQKRVAEEIRGLDFSRPTTMTTRIRGIRNRAQKELEELLLPHQVERLRQLHNRSRLRSQGLVDLLTEAPIREELEISSDQEEELRKEEAKLEAELQEKIRQLRKEAREQLLGKLKPGQEKKAKQLLGEEFDFGKQETKGSGSGKKRPGK